MVQGSVSLSFVCGDEDDDPSVTLITEHVLVFRWFLTSSSGKPVFTVPILSLKARSSCSDKRVIKSGFNKNITVITENFTVASQSHAKATSQRESIKRHAAKCITLTVTPVKTKD